MPAPVRPTTSEPLPLATFRWHCRRHDASNFALLKHRHFDGFLVTMKNSGTHWLKHMMSTALALELELPLPQFADQPSRDDFISHPRHPRRYPQAPRLASTHSIPHAWFDSPALRACVKLPTYAVLVRDLRAALVSNYEKWKDDYGVSFKEYLRGDPRGQRYVFDIWGGIHFLNRWGRVAQRFPAATLEIRYEDLQASPASVLGAIFEHFNITISPRHLAPAILSGSKQNMVAKAVPVAPEQRVVRADERAPTSWFDAEDREYFDHVVACCLADDHGYDWRWPAL